MNLEWDGSNGMRYDVIEIQWSRDRGRGKGVKLKRWKGGDGIDLTVGIALVKMLERSSLEL